MAAYTYPLSYSKQAFDIIKKVNDHINGISKNDEYRTQIQSNMDRLRAVAKELSESKEEDIPESCIAILTSFEDNLSICNSICTSHDKFGNVRKILQSEAHLRELKTVESELSKASDNLQLVLTHILRSQIKKLSEKIERGHEDVKRDTQHPHYGIYAAPEKKCPFEVNKPIVILDQDLMAISWKDQKNPLNSNSEYEVRYDDEKNLAFPMKAEKCISSKNPNTFAIKLGPPKIQLGHLYNIQVRAINRAGPGKWSRPCLFRFKTGPPNKPKKPMCSPLSPTSVAITAKKFPEMDQNGSPVTQCIIEYTQQIEGSESTWKKSRYNISKGTEMKIEIDSLKPDTIYNFRVKMRNKAGKSPPSDSTEVVTGQFIPDPPINGRVSSKRTHTIVKIRWEKPAEYTEAVCAYNIQMRREKEREWKQSNSFRAETLSRKFTGLKTGTHYLFRIQSVNNKGETSTWTQEIEACTRIGKAGRVAAITGGFVVGTIGGPIVGAVGVAAGLGIAAGERVEKKGGKIAAGVAAGTGGAIAGALIGGIGAPFMGAATGKATHDLLTGKYDTLSPQTSDEETDEEFTVINQ